ncbi:MAG: phosphotransferase family protein [Acidimicrobiia bacterium]|nr:phosphotransferase family protein [Acidimicrobiia bacterium]
MGSIDTPDGVDLERLRPYFAQNVAGAGDRELSATLISGGRSNLTYAISDGTSEWVLRRPPLGHVLPTAHDMGREHRVLAGLAGTDVPVPRVFAFCDDESVNGAPFYVMEKVDGVILRTSDDLAVLDERDARACSEALVDVLARIHAVDYEAVGLRDFGHPDGFLERQVRRWGEQWERSKTRPLPAIEELARRLRAALPESPPPTIVHGDYRLDNTMLAAGDPSRIVAVLDWEMATLGDPLADLGLFLLYYGRSDAQVVATGATIDPDAGFLARDEVIARYASLSGRSVEQLDFYETLAAYKLAIIVEGIHARFLMGKTLGDGFDSMGGLVESLAESALEACGRSSIAALRG